MSFKVCFSNQNFYSSMQIEVFINILQFLSSTFCYVEDFVYVWRTLCFHWIILVDIQKCDVPRHHEISWIWIKNYFVGSIFPRIFWRNIGISLAAKLHRFLHNIHKFQTNLNSDNTIFEDKNTRKNMKKLIYLY